ncbi:hypothetical protein IGB42_02391 [Andreprevotia sp. IGB-42]|uniref:hypothetical protein n=1 Tax=Andreprevotia sp. IGB-42 TaxID=2497473 RepID=UPI001356E63A|nr:hypothetical protein [Andreprevotia sp. IGB-42]KAF0812995.1 hypothetical protein IGB42_02391 [Andreprevotia sp. IGB-42]
MSLIDTYLPVFQFRERHSLPVDAPPAALMDAVMQPEITDDPWMQRFIKLREWPSRALGKLGGGNRLANRGAFGLGDFVLLGRDADHEIALGAVGKFWRFDYGLVPMADATAFSHFSNRGTPKLVLNFRIETGADGQHRLSTETRIFCNDRLSYLRFLPYWCLIRPVSGLIRRRLLARIHHAARTLP